MKSRFIREDTILYFILRPHSISVEIRTRAAEQGTQVSSSTPLPSGQTNSTLAGEGMNVNFVR